MVFASFTPADKQAFFALLDEYFESRPHLLAGAAANAATHEAKRQISAKGPAIASFARSQLGGITGNGAASGGPPRVAPRPVSSAPAPSAGAQDDNEESAAPMSIADRLAAFGGKLNPGAPGATPSPPPAAPAPRSVAPAPPVAPARPGPPAAPRRGNSGASAPSPKSTSSIDGLVSTKSFSGIDTTSKMGAFVSMGKSKREPATGSAPPVPPAFPDQRKRDIVPPPVRRAGAPAPKREVTPPAAEEEDETAEGDWGEILYDYESEDPNDLNVSARQRVWITERTSEDWWTGQIDGEGKSGLFPSSYVRLL